MNELALFAGAGGGILGGHLLGWRTVCAVERDPYAASVLLARQNDGVLPHFPVWDDVCTFDGEPWRGIVDVVSGGFPCQDISVAGTGRGLDGERSGLWGEMARIVGEVRPRFVFVENSPMLTSRGLGRILGDLALLGFDAAWRVLSAADLGAPHLRERIWIVAHSHKRCVRGVCADARDGREVSEEGLEREFRGGYGCEDVADANRAGRKEQRRPVADGEKHETAERGGWWRAEPDVGRVVDGLAARVHRLKAIGNGQVPIVAAAAFTELREALI